MLPLLCQPQHAPPFALTLVDWLALSPGLASPNDWISWANNKQGGARSPSAPFEASHHPSTGTPTNTPGAAAPSGNSALCTLHSALEGIPAPSTPLIPMMIARRLGKSTRFAIQCALELMQRHPVDALVFSSRHGELERTFQILDSIENNTDISPTDFAMSVHNAAAGQLTITAKKKLPASSVAAGDSTFQQALHEVRAFLAAGNSTVLHVDFESPVPPFYQPLLHEIPPPYAAAFIWTNNDNTPANTGISSAPVQNSPLPPSLQFLKSILQNKSTFTVTTPDARWQWHSSKN